jgi:hypothetical protein
MATSDPAPEPWHLDKKVPIALIATIFAQTVAIVWWASGVDHRVTAGRAELATVRTEIQTRYDRMAESQRVWSEQIIEQRADVKAIRATPERLERQIKPPTEPLRSGATERSRITR